MKNVYSKIVIGANLFSIAVLIGAALFQNYAMLRIGRFLDAAHERHAKSMQKLADSCDTLAEGQKEI